MASLTIEDFICPWEGQALQASGTGWRCLACGRCYPLRNGIPDFVDSVQLPESQRFEQQRREALVDFDQGRIRYERRVERDAILRRLNAAGSRREQSGRQLSEKVLDAGCGAGHITRRLLRRGAEVTALDFARSRLEHLGAQVGAARFPAGARLRLVAADILHLPFRPASFGTIVCTQVLEHLPTAEARQQLLASLARLLAPGGRLLLTVYNYSEAWRRRGVPVEGRHDSGIFYHCYRAGELEEALVQAGLAVGELTGLVHLLPHTYRLLPGLGPAGRAFDHGLEPVTGLSQRWGQLLLAVAGRTAYRP